MEKGELRKVAEEIAGKLPVEKIYCLNNEDIGTYHLILLLPPMVGVKLTELEPFVKIATNGRKNITFTLYLTSDVKGALKTGNLFFHIACIDNNLIYNKVDSPGLPLPKADELLKWKNEAIIHFKDGLDKTTAFLEGADFYNQKNEPGLTVFMLHQVIELTFRALELAILAKEKKTHSISIHQSFITPFIPQLGILFPADTAEEKEILRTLNDAYSAVRYEQNHKVEEKYIPVLFERVALLQKRSKTIIDNLSAILDEKEKEALSVRANGNDLVIVERSSPLDDLNTNEYENLFFNTSSKLKEVITLIVENRTPDQIYVFGNIIFQTIRSHLFSQERNAHNNTLHYDLLAISSVPNPYGNNIQSIVNTIDGITINLFIHSKDEVLKKIENQNKFFQTVIQHGQLVYSKITLIDKGTILKTDIELNYTKTKANATRRIFRATAILKAAALIKDEVFEVTVFLLSQSLEQACLGLIYNFWGYSPNLHSLTHLLSICKIFWPENEDYFPMQTLYDKKLLAILSQSHSELRYAVSKSIDPDDLNEVYLRCNSFVLRSEKVYLNTLSDLEIEEYEAVN
ncbi:HEPN domain-containing protein [Mucilaginibacter rubeus]|uniref:HEPN domain-containing protein n=1 Tax=Mucilaginibacter rubeus TaxID=2027860 RepID=A0AAE6JCH6_9SPHI|nr:MULTISPECIES: HEPN domain-containing protein [Mucilaginibacter]QEM03055.1 HEPN domain-containing protein [Mucilaginibacter rubeus]QEM15674.1 HEPN domain-containing protein [Mucilaginibacter gossypii]QTE41592.1 HEPN domain-containing protein [Mucilaginibacter rubeus]QTE48197.1 HEPN domain-containing protein [Mucilaginibacter rubeus]QTE59586.1 HEPN domain-containing protein [Mucilaginibacter rubeus]